MKATLLPVAVLQTKAHRAAVSVMAKDCIVACVLPLRCFYFYYPTTNLSMLSENKHILYATAHIMFSV